MLFAFLDRLNRSEHLFIILLVLLVVNFGEEVNLDILVLKKPDSFFDPIILISSWLAGLHEAHNLVYLISAKVRYWCKDLSCSRKTPA